MRRRRGYRGLVRELARTGSRRALLGELVAGLRHGLRTSLRRRPPVDAVTLLRERYGDDGYRAPDPAWAELALAAEACLVCGLCSLECARVGGRPALDPRDAVAAASRLAVDWARLGVSVEPAGDCGECAACDLVCPVEIPIRRIQDALGRDAAGAPAGRPATGAPAAAPSRRETPGKERGVGAAPMDPV